MRYIRDFHKPSQRILVPSEETKQELEEHKFDNTIEVCANGVDTKLFKPRPKKENTRRPFMVFVGRVSKEKSIEDFLEADLPGTKVVVGEGPQREELEAKYKDAVFTGPKFGDELTQYYQAADVFVFPSRTDTFGLVNVEALACAIPVAAYPVRGPLEILDGAPAGCGAMDEDLRTACLTAYEARDPAACREWAEKFSWEAATRQFVANLETTEFDEQFWLRSAKMID